MKIRDTAEIISLDEELNLFKEQDWDFLNQPILERSENWQFYNDVRDKDFDIKVNNRENLKNALTIITIMVIACVGIGILKFGFLDNDKSEYDRLVSMSNISVEDGNKLIYIDGEQCSDTEFYAVSNTVNGYFSVLKSEEHLNYLSSYCSSKDANFTATYNKYKSKMKTNYDIYDCYARALKATGGYCTLNRVDRVIKKDDKYYAYVVLNVPTVVDVQNYVNTYKVNMTKYFTINEQNDNNFYRFLLKTMQDYAMPTTESMYCFEMKKVKDDFYFVDDSQITKLCIQDFTSAIAYMSILVEKI